MNTYGPECLELVLQYQKYARLHAAAASRTNVSDMYRVYAQKNAEYYSRCAREIFGIVDCA